MPGPADVVIHIAKCRMSKHVKHVKTDKHPTRSEREIWTLLSVRDCVYVRARACMTITVRIRAEQELMRRVTDGVVGLCQQGVGKAAWL